MFTYRTAEECRGIAARTSENLNLYKNVWHAAEIACVLGNNSAEAAERALRIAEAVSDTRRVVFFDFQGSSRSFGERTRANSPRNLLRVDIALADLDPADPGKFLSEIEETLAASGARVCVMDSLFYLCEWYGKPRAARFFISKLREMGRRLEVAFLIGANARKRIGKDGYTGAEHLPKGTAPYVDVIIPSENDSIAESDLSLENNQVQISEKETETRSPLLFKPMSLKELREMKAASETCQAPRSEKPSVVRRKKRRK